MDTSLLVPLLGSSLLLYRAFLRSNLLRSRTVEKEFLRAVSLRWQSNPDHLQVNAAGRNIASASVVPVSTLCPDSTCEAPPLPIGAVPAQLWQKLLWRTPPDVSTKYTQTVGDRVKSAHVIGSTTQAGAFAASNTSTAQVGVMWFAPYTHYPAHTHAAHEFFHIISGSAEFTKGDQQETWQLGEANDFFFHAAGQSNALKTQAEPLVVLFYWSRAGQHCFAPIESAEDALKGSYNDITKTIAYYDTLAVEYTEVVVHKWGYTMPIDVVQFCTTQLKIPPSAKVLDLGCGSGLVGLEFKKSGYNALTGIDLSTVSLKVAKQRNLLYQRLLVGDLSCDLIESGVLPREGMFDVIVCVGTTTYLAPSVLQGWIKLIRPGGWIVLTHKTVVSEIWEPMQKELVEKGELEHVRTSPELNYLPGFAVDSNENGKAKIYGFRRPK